MDIAMATTAHSHLIVGGTREKRKEEARKIAELEDFSPEPDLFLIQREERKQVGIERIRKLERYLSLKAYGGKTKRAIILEAQNLTKEAQNALLKTLEEPPASSLIVLTASHLSLLLPTVISRCQIKKLGEENEVDLQSREYRKAREKFLALIPASRGERLAWAERNKKQISDRDEAKELLSFWLAALRETLLETNRKEGVGERGTEAAKEGLRLFRLLSETNLSPRLALEYFLLQLP